MRRPQTIFVPILLLTLLGLSAITSAQTEETPRYQEYQARSGIESLFTVSFTRTTISVSRMIDSVQYTETIPKSSLVVTPQQVEIRKGQIWFDQEGLHFQGPGESAPTLIPYTDITDTRVTDGDGAVDITFFTVTGDTDRLGRLRRGNEISFNDPITIESQRFVRGLVMSVTGNIQVNGEVNKDVISLLGNVLIGSGATARGDVATAAGTIDLTGNPAVYGELYSSGDYFDRRRPRLYDDENYSLDGDFVYNRVDGATPSIIGEFRDADSILPAVWIKAGYAFESERWRTEFGIEQPIWRKRPLLIGAAFYQRRASQDDWLLGDTENTIFALLATEDYKDYWEGEGGVAWLHFEPLTNWQFETRYRYEETNWLPASRHLWSLFGGDKLFRENFHYVPTDFRQMSIPEIDTTSNAHLSFLLDWDTHLEGEPFTASGWHATAELEWSHPDLNSDFDYRRYSLALRRYQKVHKESMILLRGMYGGSDGYLPMYKRFYIGGLGTLRGYKFKEYLGTRFWLGNAEYRFEFPETDVAISVLWDIGQIANESPLNSDVEVKQSIGAAVMFSDDVRISLAKRLDRSFGDEPIFNVRFDFVF